MQKPLTDWETEMWRLDLKNMGFQILLYILYEVYFRRSTLERGSILKGGFILAEGLS